MTSQRKPEAISEGTLAQALVLLHEGIERLASERLVNRLDARIRHEEISTALAKIGDNTQPALGELNKLERAILSAPKGKRGRPANQAHIALFIELSRSQNTWEQIRRLCNNEFKRQFANWRQVRDIWRRYYGDKRAAFDPATAHSESQKIAETTEKGRAKK